MLIVRSPAIFPNTSAATRTVAPFRAGLFRYGGHEDLLLARNMPFLAARNLKLCRRSPGADTPSIPDAALFIFLQELPKPLQKTSLDISIEQTKFMTWPILNIFHRQI
jgi:hypothetical protein